MATYSVADLIGKNFIAKSSTPIYRVANDDAKPYATIKAGQPVGILYSYLSPKQGRSDLWFAFNDANGKPYYTKYKKGAVDESNIKAQGVKSTEQKTKEATETEQKQSEGLFQFYIEKYVPYILVGLFLLPIIKEKLK